jgi:fumarate hydratase class II
MTRILADSMGEMSVPDDALYGPQTARAVSNFPISGWPMPRSFIAALGELKLAAAQSNLASGELDEDRALAITAAAKEVIEGTLDAHFPVDVFQTGSGTSSNMNANEVIASRATQRLAEAGSALTVHPNDHVNLGQSSNDVIPSAIHLAAAISMHDELVPTLRSLMARLTAKAREFDDVVKIGRTHRMDAVPMTLGQEFDGFEGVLQAAMVDLRAAMTGLCELPLGGTAIGTGLNAPATLASDVCMALYETHRLPFCEAENHMAANSHRGRILSASGALRRLALGLGKIASDIRLLGSGPRCGFGELRLPALQPGSSIMPGKINPVICESVIQVACQVVGCDAAIAAGATGGVGSILQLNVALPMMASNLLTSIRLLTNVMAVMEEKLIAGLEANADQCAQAVEQSLAMVTVLAPVIGYDEAATLAKEAMASGKTIREIATEKAILPKEQLDTLLDARNQT